MTDVYTASILFMVTFLLICWVVTEFQIYNDSHSMEDEMKKPRMASKLSVGQIRLQNALENVRDFRKVRLWDKNRSLLLFEIGHRDRKKECRPKGRTDQR